MDIEEFYDADPRRRESAEIEFGADWHDAAGVRYELNWIEDTGELYVMREPTEQVAEDPFGDFFLTRVPASGLVVRVLTRLSDRAHVEQILDGWRKAIAGPDSTSWVVGRLKAAGVGPDEGSDPDGA